MIEQDAHQIDGLDGQASSQTTNIEGIKDGHGDDRSGPSPVRFPSPESNPATSETRTNACLKRESKSTVPESASGEPQSPFTRSISKINHLGLLFELICSSNCGKGAVKAPGQSSSMSLMIDSVAFNATPRLAGLRSA